MTTTLTNTDSTNVLHLDRPLPPVILPMTNLPSGTVYAITFPKNFQDKAARVGMDHVLWCNGLKRFSVCPAPLIEDEYAWRLRMVKNRAPPPRDLETGRFIRTVRSSSQDELPDMPSSLSELHQSLAAVRVPKRQSKRRNK